MHKFFETYMEVTLTALSGLISITIFVFFMYNNLTSTIKANQNIFNDGNFKGQITVNDIRSQERMVIYINDYLLDDSDFQSIVVHKGEENFDFYALASYLNNDNGKVPFTKDNDSFALKSDISGIDIQIYLMENGLYKNYKNVNNNSEYIDINSYMTQDINGTRLIDKKGVYTLKYCFKNSKDIVKTKTINIIIN